jgi:hypothetical protein
MRPRFPQVQWRQTRPQGAQGSEGEQAFHSPLLQAVDSAHACSSRGGAKKFICQESDKAPHPIAVPAKD